jgi:hypothetical protein
MMASVELARIAAQDALHVTLIIIKHLYRHIIKHHVWLRLRPNCLSTTLLIETPFCPLSRRLRSGYRALVAVGYDKILCVIAAAFGPLRSALTFPRLRSDACQRVVTVIGTVIVLSAGVGSTLSVTKAAPVSRIVQ